MHVRNLPSLHAASLLAASPLIPSPSGPAFAKCVVPGASHPIVTNHACPGRQLLVAQQVTASIAIRQRWKCDKTKTSFAALYCLTFDTPRAAARVAPCGTCLAPRRIAARSVIVHCRQWRCLSRYVVPGASHPTVTSRARPGRQLLAVQQVTARRAARDKTEADFAIHYLADLRPADGDTCRTDWCSLFAAC